MPARWWCVPALAMVLLAGCSAKTDSTTSDAAQSLKLQATQDTGVIKGLVVDDAIRPVANATVHLATPSRNTTSNAEGAFGFEGLKSGSYFFTVSKKGFSTVQGSAEVVAGVSNPETKRVQVMQLASSKPFHDVSKFNGNQAFGVTGRVPGYGNPRFVSSVPSLFSGTFEFIASYAAQPAWQQTLVVWDAKTPAAQTMLVDECVYVGSCGSSGKILQSHQVSGPSPLVWSANAALQQAFAGNATGKDDMVVWAGGTGLAPGGADVGLTVDQDFRLIQVHTYNWQPADTYRFDKDGEPADPPK